MIPVKLTIQGLFSYQEKQTIDFQRLTEVHLFGIFGSVGSGKSSILDAITYSLYGETERMNARDNRNYNMMNLKSDELFIEFDFLTGKEGIEYRTVVKGRRNRKKFEDVKSLDRTAYKNQGGKWEPIQVEELQQVIGLSYENFKRTIIIPQGKFQEFLQLGNKDRTLMMKELFNLGKFELYYKAEALDKKNNEQIQKLQGQLQQLGEVKPEQLEIANQQLDTISEEITQLTVQLSAKKEEELALNQLHILFGKLKDQQTIFETLKAKEDVALKSEKAIKEYEHCLINYKNLFDRSAELNKVIEQLGLTIKNENSILTDCKSRLLVLENDFANIKYDYEQRDLIKLQAEELIKIIRIIELNSENGKITERIKNGENIANISDVKIQEYILLQNRLNVELKILKSKLPDLAELAKVQNWFTVRKSLLATDLENKKESEIIQKEINNLNDRFIKSVESFVKEAEQPLLIPDWIELLVGNVEKIKVKITVIDQNIEHLLIRAKLKDYATNLEDGKPCPLCGSLTHPEILDSADVSNALQKARDSKNNQLKAIELLEKVMVSLREIEIQLQLKRVLLQNLAIKKEKNQERIVTHQTLFVWPEYSDENKVNTSFNEAKTIQASIKTKDIQLDKSRIELEKERKLLENYIKELNRIKEEQTGNQSEINTLTRQIVNLDIETYLEQPKEKVRQLSDSLLFKYSKLESAHLKITKEIALVQKKIDELYGKIQAYETNLTQQQEVQAGVMEQISHLISESDYTSIDQIKDILIKKIDIETEKQKIQDFMKQLHGCENQLTMLKSEIKEREYSADDHLKLKEEVLKLSEVLTQKNRELGKKEGEIRKLIKDIEQQKEILNYLHNIELRAEDIKTLKQLFKGSGFVNYVSSVHLQNLCRAANDRFNKLVKQKMSLEITDDNNFQVRDFMNGGKVRSVKTLSGGQTFQAALSLALALADSIHKFTESSQNFFFLDEGFGSLDKESLDVVFVTLKSLRKENRIVGVISHVEEMQQEIDTHLRIVNNEETGSHIYGSWEK